MLFSITVNHPFDSFYEQKQVFLHEHLFPQYKFPFSDPKTSCEVISHFQDGGEGRGDLLQSRKDNNLLLYVKLERILSLKLGDHITFSLYILSSKIFVQFHRYI